MTNLFTESVVLDVFRQNPIASYHEVAQKAGITRELVGEIVHQNRLTGVITQKEVGIIGIYFSALLQPIS